MKKKTFTLTTIVLTILATSCSGDLDYMIEEYNSRFGIHDDRVLLLPGDIGYNERDMILPDYHVHKDNTLNIPAPYVADASYKWQVLERGKEIEDCWSPKNGMNTHTFHLLERNLPIGTYLLRVTLVIGSQTLMDEAKLSVHQEGTPDIP